MNRHVTTRPPRATGVALSMAVILLAPATGPVALGAQGMRLPPEARIDSLFARYDSTTTPGCATAVVHGDSVVFRKAYGMAHLGFGVPMTTATTVPMPYSEGRIFVALGIATLVRDGALSFDDPVRKHVPELPAYAAAVTVRHLLYHTSGLADYGVLDPGFDLTDRFSEDAMFRALARWGRLNFAPGRAHMYSNTDFALLKILVERVARRSLHAHLDTTLLSPLGMHATRIGPEVGIVRRGHALLHERTDSGWSQVLRYRTTPTGGIAVTTSVDDLVRFARAVRDSSTGVPALLTALDRDRPPGAPSEGRAYGVYRRALSTHALTEFRGIGEYLWLVRDPEADVAVATLCTAYGGMWRFGPELAALVVPRESGAHALPAAAPAAPTVAVPVAQLRRLVGTYARLDGRGGRTSFVLRGDTLMSTPDDGSDRAAPMRPIGRGRFEVEPPGGGRYHLDFIPADTVPGGIVLTIRDVATGADEPPLGRVLPIAALTASTMREYTGTYDGERVEATLYIGVHDGALTIEGRGIARTVLSPLAWRDRFTFDVYVVRFVRDAAGRVTHAALDAVRIKDIRFARRREAPGSTGPR